jgi:hypothetical protein
MKTQTATSFQIFREAARRVAEGEQQYSCSAVEEAEGELNERVGFFTQERETYCYLLSPDPTSMPTTGLRVYHFAGIEPDTEETLAAAKAHRVLALLFAAEFMRNARRRPS